MTRGKPTPPAIGPGMTTRKLVVSSRDVVFAKGVIEALDGLAAVFAEHGGELILAAPHDRSLELDAVAKDLARELGGVLSATGDEGEGPPR